MADHTPAPRLRLCDLDVGVKLGLTGIVLVFLGGLLASAAHLKFQHENRDEQPGLSMNDIRGAYHGVDIPSRLLAALQQGHPNGLAADDRKVLVDWLNSARINIDYDNLDLGDKAPAEIIARDCVSCHSEKAADKQPVAAKTPLDTFEKVQKLAFPLKIDPPPIKILAMSTHAHALSLATMSVVIGALLLMTRLPRPLAGGACMLMGLALAADLAAWWLSRGATDYSLIIVIAGALYNGLTGLSLVFIGFDLWIPRPRR